MPRCVIWVVIFPLSRTRWIADLTLGLLDGWDVADVPDKVAFTAEVAMYAGTIPYELLWGVHKRLAFVEKNG